MRSILFLAAFAASTLLFPGLASATRLYFDTNGNIIGHDVTDKYPGSRSAAPHGANANVGGTSRVPLPGGGKLPVPVNATIPLSKAAVGKAAAKRAAAAALGPAGAAYTVGAVAEELLDPGDAHSEWVKCGVMDLFLCKRVDGTGGAPTSQTVYTVLGSSYGSTPLQACVNGIPQAKIQIHSGVYRTSPSGPFCNWYRSSGGSDVLAGQSGYSTVTKSLCSNLSEPDTSKPLSEQCGPEVPGEPVPATETEIEQSLQEKMDADYEAARRLVDAMHKDMEAAGADFPADHSPYKADTPVDVDAPPVTSPERTTKVETIPRSDGSIDTRTTKETTTVNPERTGTNIGNTEIKFPSQTVVTTTTVNNVTNNTSVQTTVVNNVAPEAVANSALPNDYAREKTLQETRDALKTAGAADMVDQGAVVDASKTKNDADLDTLFSDSETGVDADKERFFSWVWTPPVGVCAPFAGTVHGYEISWDLCPTIENINAVIGWLFALFSAMTVYGQLFKRND